MFYFYLVGEVLAGRVGEVGSKAVDQPGDELRLRVGVLEVAQPVQDDTEQAGLHRPFAFSENPLQACV